MFVSLRMLRQMIKEEVERCVQNSAGFYSGNVTGIGKGYDNNLDSLLGDEETPDESEVKTTIGTNNVKNITINKQRIRRL